MSTEETDQLTKKLVTTYKLQVSTDVIASAFASQPKLPVLLSRASFRPDFDAQFKQRARIQRERRNFLRILGLTIVSVPFFLWLQASYSAPQAQTSTSVTNSVPTQISTYPTNSITTSAQPVGTMLAKAASIPTDQSLTFNDPSLGPIILIHLDNGQFVAYSSICTHAGCQVQFDPSGRNIVCPCHGAVFDPYNSAQVLGGPAPYPLQKVPIQYDPSTGNIYLAG